MITPATTQPAAPSDDSSGGANGNITAASAAPHSQKIPPTRRTRSMSVAAYRSALLTANNRRQVSSDSPIPGGQTSRPRCARRQLRVLTAMIAPTAVAQIAPKTTHSDQLSRSNRAL